MPEIYEPQEDSYFFSEFLKENLNNKEATFLDIGCGSCILADTAKEKGLKYITCADINQNAVNLARCKGYKSINSDLFEDIDDKYDIICFNSPYLPEDNREPKESKTITTGGKKGDEIPLKFIKQAKEHLNAKGKIYLLISSITPMNSISKHNPKIVAKKKIFFEELLILELTR